MAGAHGTGAFSTGDYGGAGEAIRLFRWSVMRANTPIWASSFFQGIPPYQLAANMKKCPAFILAPMPESWGSWDRRRPPFIWGCCWCTWQPWWFCFWWREISWIYIWSDRGHNGLWDDDFKPGLSRPGGACDAFCGAAGPGGNVDFNKKKGVAARLFGRWISFWHCISHETNRGHFRLLGRDVFDFGVPQRNAWPGAKYWGARPFIQPGA